MFTIVLTCWHLHISIVQKVFISVWVFGFILQLYSDVSCSDVLFPPLVPLFSRLLSAERRRENRQRWATCVPSVLAPLSTCASSPCGLVCILPVMSYLHFAVCVLVLFWLVLLLVATVYSFFYFVCRLHQFCCQPFCFWIIGFWARTSALTKARFEFLPACSVPCVWLLFQITVTRGGAVEQ